MYRIWVWLHCNTIYIEHCAMLNEGKLSTIMNFEIFSHTSRGHYRTRAMCLIIALQQLQILEYSGPFHPLFITDK